ncbi:MAG TPA: enoyl-CoA hydratase-related protein [Candidatus Saccharimonadales bacterium]|nr:enoyl-CoA hydratase-related protein [Candidatus Saccharimonadales bacterium]
MSDVSTPLIVDRRAGGVTVLTLNNPDRRNALDPPLARVLLDVAADLRADRGARCVVITGAGKAFCSGADLGTMKSEVTAGPLARRDWLSEFYRVFLNIRQLPMPVIAAVNGAAIGAGLNLALCCDIRLAARSARFGATFVRLGIHAGGGATYLLSRLVGPAVAAELLLSGELIDAERALSTRLVNRIVDDDVIVEEAVTLATTIAANSPQAVRATKRTLALALDATFAATLEVEALAQAITQDSDDATEGWAAFRERRPPIFRD